MGDILLAGQDLEISGHQLHDLVDLPLGIGVGVGALLTVDKDGKALREEFLATFRDSPIGLLVSIRLSWSRSRRRS